MRQSSTPPEELIRACTDTGNPAAWEEFIRQFHGLIATVALRTARRWTEPPSHLVDDLVQDVYLKLYDDNCRLLREFKPQHANAIFGFLKVVTANVVHDHFKSAHAGKRGSGKPEESLDPGGTLDAAEPGSTHAMEQHVLLQEVKRYVDECTEGPDQERNRQVFWLYYRHGLSARAIASIPSIGLSIKGVESTILRLSRLVRQRIAESGQRDQKSKPGEGLQPAESF